MIFVKNSRRGREVNTINTLSKKTFVKNRVGGRGVTINLDNVCKYTVCFFWTAPLTLPANFLGCNKDKAKNEKDTKDTKEEDDLNNEDDPVSGKWQVASSKRQAASGKQQAASGKQQAAISKQQVVSSI